MESLSVSEEFEENDQENEGKKSNRQLAHCF